MTFYPNILHPRQQQVLGELAVSRAFDYYLAGGTALALQLGHRTSLDFDFYSSGKLEGEKLATRIKQALPTITISSQTDDTFQAIAAGVNISVFYYPYHLLHALIDYPPIQLASLEDIAAMKIVALVQRARQRDFWDIYYLIERLGIANVIASAYRKYPWYEENSQIVLRALTYFEDADGDEEVSRVTIFDKNLRWTDVKEKIRQEVKTYLKETA
ncbi:nucleotidyl transferase AbiEii/AbiGii toxin family protein [Candidatus Gottesmanbacteria bacterium]|nr:nucleotidyl transferase AbiEii/AbiGii toxin family protein [Candidatus Gottesmanbacteria bacterium]